MGNDTDISVERCITAGVTPATAVVKTGSREQIYAHFSCINLHLSLLVTSAPEQVGSEVCLHGNVSTAHLIIYRLVECYKNKVLQNYTGATLQASADTSQDERH